MLKPKKNNVILLDHTRVYILTAVALIAFAANSVLCRMALKNSSIDAISFTNIRLLSGACVLYIIFIFKHKAHQNKSIFHFGNWLSSFALLAYAITFSISYTNIDTGIGALILFGTVQLTIIGYAIFSGERYTNPQYLGVVLAIAGMIYLVLPRQGYVLSLSAAFWMCISGLAWALYTIMGKASKNPLYDTGANFVRTLPMLVALSFAYLFLTPTLNFQGMLLAVISGALTSGLGYALWYAVVKHIGHLQSAVFQLSVPGIAALGGVLILGERFTLQLGLSLTFITVGIYLVIQQKGKTDSR